MTREEAIQELCEWLQHMIDHGVPNYSAKREALAHAISALSAPTIAFVCDGRKCGADCSDCGRTTDIEHAKNFTKVCDSYFEKIQTEPSRCEDCEYWNDTEDGCADRHGCNTDSDLISRAEAIKRFCEFGTQAERQGKLMMTMIDAKYAFIETLESMPSVKQIVNDSDLISRADAIDAVASTKPIVRSTERNNLNGCP